MLLDQMRLEGDSLADETVRKLVEGGPIEVNAASRLMLYLFQDGAFPRQEQERLGPASTTGFGDAPDFGRASASGPGAGRISQDSTEEELAKHPTEKHFDDVVYKGAARILAPYLEESAKLPPWYNEELIEQGEKLFEEHGIIAFSVLGCASLPTGYAVPLAAKVLGFTQQLEKHAKRRLAETVFFLMDVMVPDRVSGVPGGLHANGNGIHTIQRVRLMHAAIRHLLTASPRAAHGTGKPEHLPHAFLRYSWDVDKDGMPLNQVLMSATILCFSYIALRSLRQLGVRLSPQDERAYLHCWNVAGYVIGVKDELLLPRPESMEDAKTKFNEIWEEYRGRKPTPDTVQLTSALLDFLGEPLSGLGYFKHAPKTLMRALVGRQVTKVLGVKFSFGEELLVLLVLPILRWADYLEGKFVGVRKASFGLLHRMIVQMEKEERGGDRPPFRIPTRLKEKWGEACKRELGRS
ncbi:MAG: oxygenase MpaB family protein [Betaproteobacteria bacterium]